MTRRPIPIRLNYVGARRPVVPFGTPLPPPPPPPPPPPDPNAWLVQGGVPGYFVAPANVPVSTTRITFEGEFRLPTLPASTSPAFDYLFTQASTGCDLAILSNGSVTITVEDSVGAKVINNVTVVPSGFWQINTDYTVVMDVNHAAQQAVVTINGGAYSIPFSTPGTGSFQTAREVSFAATTVGASPLPTGTQMRNLKVSYNGTLHKVISNIAAEANADAWHQGGDFTNA